MAQKADDQIEAGLLDRDRMINKLEKLKTENAKLRELIKDGVGDLGAINLACDPHMWESNGEYNEMFKYMHTKWFQVELEVWYQKAIAILKEVGEE